MVKVNEYGSDYLSYCLKCYEAEVAEACVVGIPHPKWDERPMLFIVTNSGEPIEKESIIEFLSDKVAKWWLPDEIVFLKELPHGATGKLQKFELREEYSNHYMEQ